MTAMHGSGWALVSRVGGPGGQVRETWALNDPLAYYSWIIGPAVVNAFYSPNRNQIGMFTPPPTSPALLPSEPRFSPL